MTLTLFTKILTKINLWIHFLSVAGSIRPMTLKPKASYSTSNRMDIDLNLEEHHNKLRDRLERIKYANGPEYMVLFQRLTCLDDDIRNLVRNNKSSTEALLKLPKLVKE